MTTKKEDEKKGCAQCENSNLKGIHTCSKKSKKQSKKDADDSKLWLIIGNEELPLGIAVAKTSGGAKRIYMERTGNSRDLVHVEELKFHKQFVGFTPLV